MGTSSRLGGEGHHGARAGQRWLTAPTGVWAHIDPSTLTDQGEALPADPLELQIHDVGSRLSN